MRRSLAILAVLLTSSIAAAQAPGETLSFDPQLPPGQVEPAPTTISYRAHILAADGISLGLIALGPLASDDAELSALGLGGYFLAAPLVHLSHGRGAAAVKSLALRAGLPFAGALVGYRVGPNDLVCDQIGEGGTHESCPGGSVTGMVVGMLAGGVTAIVVDAKYLARHERRTPTWTASVTPTSGGMTVGIGGAF
jgi:hypothetical protein